MVRSGRSAAWLARLLREQEVDGSNPFAPTNLEFLVVSLQSLVFERTSNPSSELQQGAVSFSIRHPDVFDLHGMAEGTSGLRLPCVEAIDRAPLAGKYLIQISNG